MEIRTYEIIYKLIEDIEAAMVGMLAPEYRRGHHRRRRGAGDLPRPAHRQDRRLLRPQRSITRGSKVRFLREGTIIWKGAIRSLRRFKDDVREVQPGSSAVLG